jgi:hypothetical protein
VNESWEQASNEERSEVGDDGFGAPMSPPCRAKQSNPTNTSSVQFDSTSNHYYELGPSPDSSDSSGSDPSDGRKVSASAKGDGSTCSNSPPPKTSAFVSKSPDSGSSGSSDSSQSSGDSGSSADELPYADLIPYASKIKWVSDSKGVKWPVYDHLTNKELKEILTGRKQAIYGKKDVLIRRLETRDKRRQYLCDANNRFCNKQSGKAAHAPDRYNANLDSFIGTINATRQRSSSAHSSASAGPARSGRSVNDGSSKRSKSVPPSPSCAVASSSPCIEVESASSDDDSARMEVDNDAVDMFPQSAAMVMTVVVPANLLVSKLQGPLQPKLYVEMLPVLVQ